MEAAARARRLLLAQHALQAGAWRAWEFLVVVALVEARPASLLPTALFSFSVFCAVMLAGPALGAYLDAAGGLRGVEVSMGMHHGGVVAASLVIGAWFAGPGRGGAGDGAAPLFWAMVVVVCALGGGSSVGYTCAFLVVIFCHQIIISLCSLVTLCCQCEAFTVKEGWIREATGFGTRL